MKTISHHSMSSNTQIFILDFDDSFTFNIANVLFPKCQQIEVLHHSDFFSSIINKLSPTKKVAIVLGPGPGHPNDYKKYFAQIETLLAMDNVYVLAICLGHQILATIKGYKIIPSANRVHGESIQIRWKDDLHIVQRYNSLAVRPLNLDCEVEYKNEVMILSYQNARSYQFHPESIATQDQLYFFKDLLKFIDIL